MQRSDRKAAKLGYGQIPVLLAVKHAKTGRKERKFTISRRIAACTDRPRTPGLSDKAGGEGLQYGTGATRSYAKLRSSQARGAAPADLVALRASIFSPLLPIISIGASPTAVGR